MNVLSVCLCLKAKKQHACCGKGGGGGEEVRHGEVHDMRGKGADTPAHSSADGRSSSGL